jgi:SagB-type dehydrogenase family enzyme
MNTSFPKPPATVSDMSEIDTSRIRALLMGERNLFSVSELYHENSKITAAAPGIAQSIESVIAGPRGFKRYIHSQSFELPAPAGVSESSVFEAIERRRSCRQYSGAAVGLNALSELLYYGAGISDADGFRRCVPSAGGLYPLEIYMLSLNVQGLPAGAYHYDVRSHALTELAQDQFRERLTNVLFITEAVQKASAVLVITGVFGRSKIKYGERAYRFALLEAGHAMQNICLVATATGLGTCPVGGFIDDGLNDILDIDGVEEAAIYAVTVGVAE